MKRLFIIVEGIAEQRFVAEILEPHLRAHRVQASAPLLGIPGHKGGNTKYVRVRDHINRLLRSDPSAQVTTMLDLFRLGEGYGVLGGSLTAKGLAKVRGIEAWIEDDIATQMGDSFDRERFIAHIQLHEFEALLFSDPTKLAEGIYADRLAETFGAIREAFASPEDINEGPETSPSKRIIAVHEVYESQKATLGPLAAIHVGLSSMRRECPHFNEWIARLEGMG